MKIRTGFVSNSSSSSFVIITPMDYDWRTNLSEDEIKIYESCFKPHTQRGFGEDLYVYHGWSYDENDVSEDRIAREIYGDDNENFFEIADKLWWNFPNLFDKEKCFIYWNED